MREIIQCLIDWLDDNLSEAKAHRILRALADESLKKSDFVEEKRRFDSMDIAVAAKETKTNNTDANVWIDWTRTVQKYWEIRENQIIDYAQKRGLEFYPKPCRISTQGGPDPTTYMLKAEPLPKARENEDEQNTELEQIEHQGKKRIGFQYELAEKGEVKPTWWAKWLFRDGQIRLSSWHIWVILGWLLILGGGAVALSYLSWLGLTIPRPVTTRELTALITIFAFPYVIWVVFIRPWGRLFYDRIVVAPELLVALKEKSAQLELFKDGDLRMIRLVRYSAPCPICGATIHLDKGEPDFPRRLVGRCADSPREHIFSFDRVTKKGAVLRGPVV